MQHTPISTIPDAPSAIRRLARGRTIHDTSSSPEARVYVLSAEGAGSNARTSNPNALFVKTSTTGALAHEARMSTAFHELGLGPEVVEYLPGGDTPADWLVTRAVIGDDCTASRYLTDPERLCDLLAVRLRTLHELFRTQRSRLAALGIPDVRAQYLENIERGWRTGRFDPQFRPRITAADAHRIAAEAADELRTDALLHGDYCLPNIILDDWRFSGFIDLDHAGLSDRHIDVFWGAWTLWFNLHTNAYCNRFLDAYGRDVIDEGKLDAIAAMECFM